MALVLANWVTGFWAVAWVRLKFWHTHSPSTFLTTVGSLDLTMVLGVHRTPRCIVIDSDILQRRPFDLPPT